MNTQRIEKKDYKDTGSLWIHSIFYTIQGEGPFAGTPAVFVRLAGCNLQCPGCDTDYTSQRRLMNVGDLMARVASELTDVKTPRTLVVITGGEPFRQNLIPFLQALIEKHRYFVQIETNGSFKPLMPGDDWSRHSSFYNQELTSRKGIYMVCSPKTGKVHELYDVLACAFKYVMSHDSVDPEDGLPIIVLGNKTPKRVHRQGWPRIRPVYLQPMDHTNEFPLQLDQTRDHRGLNVRNYKSLEAVKESCKKHGYILQLQVHKIIGVD